MDYTLTIKFLIVISEIVLGLLSQIVYAESAYDESRWQEQMENYHTKRQSV
jgi:hypothetical protein